MSNPIQVVTTTPQRADAETIARALVEQRLAACVQVGGPLTSIYRWQGVLEKSQEWLCVAKTDRSRYEALQQAICRLHPYEVPEILAMPIVAGNDAYLAWLQAALTPAENSS